MAFVTPGFGHEVGHLAASFLPGEVGILKFGSVLVSAGEGEGCWKEGGGGRFVAF